MAPLSCYAPGISTGVSKAGPVYGKDCGTDPPGGIEADKIEEEKGGA